MANKLKGFVDRLSSGVRKTSSGQDHSDFQTASTEQKLFPACDPSVDGEDCLHDCESCDVELPRSWKIDEEDKLYGKINGWDTHLVVATGKTDWVRDVADEKGSIMEAVEKVGPKPKNGKMMLSASNMPVPSPQPHTNGNGVSTTHQDSSEESETSTTVLLLPAFTLIHNVTPSIVPELITHHVDPAPTNTTPLPSALSLPSLSALSLHPSSPFRTTPCPHRALILLCSQKTRDARCGQSAPLLRREFERHLRQLGLYRDLHDERPGGVGVYFISHVGGHKYAANVLVYRRAGSTESTASAEPAEQTKPAEPDKNDGKGEAAQCIWLARVRPEDCENIVRYTVMQGKVVKPERQLRGGFDREKRLVSW